MFVNSITAVILNKEQLLSTKREAVRRLSRTGMMTKRVDSSILVVDVYRLEETWVINDNMNRQMATYPFYWELWAPALHSKYSMSSYPLQRTQLSKSKHTVFHAKGRSRTLLACQPSNPLSQPKALLTYPINFIVWWQFASCIRHLQPQIIVFFSSRVKRTVSTNTSSLTRPSYGASWIILTYAHIFLKLWFWFLT